MTPAIFNGVKRPLLVGIASALTFTAVTVLWVKWPFVIPLAVLIVVGIAGGVVFLVSEAIVVVRLAKMFIPPGPLGGDIGNLPRRSLIGLGLTLILCNSALMYFYDLRPHLAYLVALNLAVVISWVGARVAGARHMVRRDHRRGT